MIETNIPNDVFFEELHRRILLQEYNDIRKHTADLPDPPDLTEFEPKLAPYTGSATFTYWAAAFYTKCKCVVTYHSVDDSGKKKKKKVKFTGEGGGIGFGGGAYGTHNFKLYVDAKDILGKSDFTIAATGPGAYVKFHRKQPFSNQKLADGVFGGFTIQSAFKGSGKWEKD